MSLSNRSCRRLPTASAPKCVVAQGAGAAGSVLLAYRQWDPLRLARTLPSRGAGAWLGAPLLPWRVQCAVRVCAALAAGLGGWGRCRVLCPPRSPPPAPRSPRCVWRVVLSGCPLPSPAGAPFHAVCAFRELGPVALLLFPACPLHVCALALSRRPRPSCLPRSVWRRHLAWFWCRAPVGPFLAVCTPPRLLPRSRVPSDLFSGGAARSRSLRAWLGVLCPLAGGAVRPGLSGAGRGGGGAACVPPPPEAWPGGPEGRGVTLPRSVPLPSLGGHQSGCHRRRSVHGGRGLHAAPVRVRVLTPGVVRGAPLCAGAGPPACRGHCGSRHVAAWGRVAYGLSGVPPPGAAASLGGGGGAGGSPGLGGG